MNEHELQHHLSQIVTQWTMLREAHLGPTDQAQAARQALMQRYCGAVFRYVLRAVRDPSVAEDLTQEFALRFIQGRFGQADRERGKFRNYIKASLFRLVQDHYREAGNKPRQVPLDADSHLEAPDDQAAADVAFHESWRQELLARAWQGLEKVEAETTQPYYTILRLRVDEPDLSAVDIGQRMGTRLGRTFTAAGIRQLLHRGRERFAELLLDDIRQSMEGAATEEVIQELVELNLYKYCKDLLERQK